MSVAESSSPAAAYRPSRPQRLANTILTRALRKGRGPTFMRLLTVRGRITGEPRTAPVVPVYDGDRTWVVAPFGLVAWVLNARADGRIELCRGDDHRTYRARELGPDEAVPVLRRYLAKPSRVFVRRHVEVTAGSPDEAIAAEAARHPVFELTPI